MVAPQEVRRLNERMMELQRARREEVAQLESAVSDLTAKLAAVEDERQRQNEALAEVRTIRKRVPLSCSLSIH